ncbi:hypothetical protein [Bryocella elongata]|uniref:hypothetical protein n=1 Tax=Bryocella elongata TaxID=863522 RepID=UPI000CDED532|nr:hypothetical protein [Bryocella elongata]
MADQMLQFPSRSSSAVEPKLDAAPEEVMPPETSSGDQACRYRGLFLVKGNRPAAGTAPVTGRSSRVSQTRMIVAQVEQEIANLAARRQAERFGRVHPMPGADSSRRELRRDTPWAVVARLLRSLDRS